MIQKTYKTFSSVRIYKRGFTATIAVVIFSMSIIAFILSLMSTVSFYSDMVSKHELRIQAQLNAKACLDTIVLMVIKDYFLNGELVIYEFGCIANIINDNNGNISISVNTKFAGVNAYGLAILSISDNDVKVVSSEVK